MDSGNSGSMQSSSDGDEEYESSHCGTGADHSFPYLLPQHQQSYPHAPTPFYAAPPPSQPPYFDPLGGLFDPVSRSPGAGILNLDGAWGKSVMRSDQNNSSTTCNEMNPVVNDGKSSFQGIQPPAQLSRRSSNCNQTNENGGGGAKAALAPGRNPKKRLRASRRAPTTVLTTDTSNFRAMVQEFTGIPAPPFGSSASSSLLFPRTRLDLFGSAASNRGGGNISSPLLTDPPYLMRPFPQRIQISQPISLPFVSSTSQAPTTNTTTPVTTTITTTTAAATTISNTSSDVNYQLPLTDLGLLNNIPINLAFPSLSKTIPHGSINSPLITGNDHRSQLRSDLIEPFHNQTTGTIPSTAAVAVSRGESSRLTWAEELRLAGDEAGASSGNGGNCNHQLLHHRIAGNATEADPSKGNGAAAAVRCEGMLESWICSSTD